MFEGQSLDALSMMSPRCEPYLLSARNVEHRFDTPKRGDSDDDENDFGAYEGLVASFNTPGNKTRFETLTTRWPRDPRWSGVHSRCSTEAIPVVRREAPTTLWTHEDPYGNRPAFDGRQTIDATAVIEAASECEKVGAMSGPAEH
jgi:hypothetical protein